MAKATSPKRHHTGRVIAFTENGSTSGRVLPYSKAIALAIAMARKQPKYFFYVEPAD